MRLRRKLGAAASPEYILAVYLIFCLDWITDILAQEVVRGMREAASRGFWMTTYAPYGYNGSTSRMGPRSAPSLS